MATTHRARRQPIIPKVNQTKTIWRGNAEPESGHKSPSNPPKHWWGLSSSPHHPVGQSDPRRAARPQGHSARSRGSPRRCLRAPCSVCTVCLHGLIARHCVALYIVQLSTNVKYVLGNNLASACHALFGHGHCIVLLLMLCGIKIKKDV